MGRNCIYRKRKESRSKQCCIGIGNLNVDEKNAIYSDIGSSINVNEKNAVYLGKGRNLEANNAVYPGMVRRYYLIQKCDAYKYG